MSLDIFSRMIAAGRTSGSPATTDIGNTIVWYNELGGFGGSLAVSDRMHMKSIVVIIGSDSPGFPYRLLTQLFPCDPFIIPEHNSTSHHTKRLRFPFRFCVFCIPT